MNKKAISRKRGGEHIPVITANLVWLPPGVVAAILFTLYFASSGSRWGKVLRTRELNPLAYLIGFMYDCNKWAMDSRGAGWEAKRKSYPLSLLQLVEAGSPAPDLASCCQRKTSFIWTDHLNDALHFELFKLYEQGDENLSERRAYLVCLPPEESSLCCSCHQSCSCDRFGWPRPRCIHLWTLCANVEEMSNAPSMQRVRTYVVSKYCRRVPLAPTSSSFFVFGISSKWK